MVTIAINEELVREEVARQIKKAIEQNDQQLVLWDAGELQRRTCMSWNFIQEKFFHDENFPKHKVGNKWLFPAKECEEFILGWIKKQ